MLSFMSMNWGGLPLVSYRTIVELISAPTIAKGRTIRAEEDLNYSDTGTKGTGAELAAVLLDRHEIRGDCIYTIVQSDPR